MYLSMEWSVDILFMTYFCLKRDSIGAFDTTWQVFFLNTPFNNFCFSKISTRYIYWLCVLSRWSKMFPLRSSPHDALSADDAVSDKNVNHCQRRRVVMSQKRRHPHSRIRDIMSNSAFFGIIFDSVLCDSMGTGLRLSTTVCWFGGPAQNAWLQRLKH